MCMRVPYLLIFFESHSPILANKNLTCIYPHLLMQSSVHGTVTNNFKDLFGDIRCCRLVKLAALQWKISVFFVFAAITDPKLIAVFFAIDAICSVIGTKSVNCHDWCTQIMRFAMDIVITVCYCMQ